ncbi:MAG: YraN family protein [Pirellulales bacterium]|nr:YraN family protein [Pirellulales bacterium]
MRLPRAISAWWARARNPKPLGYLGERAAERLLKRKGYKIVARGQRLRGGELDLVAVDGRTVVFVEVKTRRTSIAGTPAEAVDARKQQRMTRAATIFLNRHSLEDYSSRFDVVAVVWPEKQRKPNMEHIIHAFEAAS